MDLIRDCLRAAVEGPFFPEWEFETIMGVDRASMRAVLQAWPKQTVDDDSFECATVNALNNLIGYPHGMDEALLHHLPAGYGGIVATLRRLDAALGGAPGKTRYVDFMR